MPETPTITALSPWYGSNRKLARAVGRELDGWPFVVVPFAGGMCELLEIKADRILANDMHRHQINLARMVRNHRAELIDILDAQTFDPDTLAAAQANCLQHERVGTTSIFELPIMTDLGHWDRLAWAASYFYTVWVGRNGTAGTGAEFRCGPCYRFDDGGGDPVKRWRSALASLPAFAERFQNCAFMIGDGIALTRRVAEGRAKSKGNARAAIYCDPPFPGPGDRYVYNFMVAQHRKLAEAVTLAPHDKCRVVMRFYDHPWVRDLYPESHWTWLHLDGGKDQHNKDKAEVLLINGPSYREAE